MSGGVIIALGVGAISGVVVVARTAFGILQRAETRAIGRALPPQEAPRLWEQADRVAGTLGALRPDHIVVGLDPTFFVTEADVVTLEEKLTGRTLFCSLPLARILTIDEFSAVIGHELGHFRGEDTAFSEKFYPIYRGSAQAIASLQAAGGRGWGVIPLLPAIAVFRFFLERFAVAESGQSRGRELLADRAGAEATSARTMATALVKVHAFAGIWSNFQRASANALAQGKMFKNASAVFVQAAVDHANVAVFQGIDKTHTSHPTDSHPPLAVRLESLQVDLTSVANDALNVRPAEAAASLIPDTEAREEALSETYQLLLAQRLGIKQQIREAALEEA